MLAKEERVPYRDFYLPGYRVIKTPIFTLKVKGNNLKKNRLGIIIGKYCEKSSVRRNFWKRHAKSVFKEFPQSSLDFVILFNSKIKDASFLEFRQELLSQIKI
jgi:ribonuclease P protein component